MIKKSLLALRALALLLAPTAMAQDDGKPTVMYLLGGPSSQTRGIPVGVLDVL